MLVRWGDNRLTVRRWGGGCRSGWLLRFAPGLCRNGRGARGRHRPPQAGPSRGRLRARAAVTPRAMPTTPKGLSSLKLDSDPLGSQFLNDSADALRVTAV